VAFGSHGIRSVGSGIIRAVLVGKSCVVVIRAGPDATGDDDAELRGDDIQSLGHVLSDAM